MKKILLSLVVGNLFSMTFAATYVLVHGAFQDQGAWTEVAPLLEAEGHTVLTLDLPGRGGASEKPLGEITLQDDVDAVLALVEAQSEPVILVGHSFGGIVISQAAEAAPDKIATLVYVAAYLPQDGQSLVTLSEEDKWNAFSETNFLISEDHSSASVLESDRVKIFCEDCSDEYKAGVTADLRDEPLEPLGTPVSLSDENFGSVRKVYIETTRDNAVSNELQKIMLGRVGVDKVMTLESSHSPFFSQPAKLADLLLNLN